MMAPPNGLILYGYAFSPYAQKVKAYLAFRNIQYAECNQHYMLPRPDLAALGVHYRRIPVMSIGRDVYIDTRAIIKRLETLFPASAEHPALTTSQSQGVALLLNNFVGNTGGVFNRATSLLTPEWGAMKDPAFQKDRSEFFGAAYMKGGWKEGKKEGITHMRHAFATLEALLQDGREWIAGTKEVSSADWEAQWVFRWYLTDLRAPKEYFNKQEYPKTFAWIDRYQTVLKAAFERSGRPTPIKGDAALEAITTAAYTDDKLVVESTDPLQLTEGVEVEVWPTDGGGHGHHDRGILKKLTRDEVAIQLKTSNGQEIRLHAPRWNFRIRAVEEATAKL
ncbi:hypothetical protein AMS68_001615 [Peltaster fructicola]|uniref:Uncharacterized protein n=1 Tax=Peltaster fructicola TaxID=286661 RepID=A0A6H0XNA4_9PEZI|nr:hypothetical protein AMS68_001615 [Peltaster fructicola]